jgi:hypothetical protein
VVTEKENQLLTDILPGSAAGDVVRRYWRPAALVDEICDDRPVIPVTVMGERLETLPSDIEEPAVSWSGTARMLKSAIGNGRPPESTSANPVAVDLIGQSSDEDCWVAFDRQRPARVRWAANRR